MSWLLLGFPLVKAQFPKYQGHLEEKPSNTNSSSSHFRTGVGRELPVALKISLSNNFHIKCISYPTLLLPGLAKPVFNPGFQDVLVSSSCPDCLLDFIICLVQVMCLKEARELAAPCRGSKCSHVKISSSYEKEIQIFSSIKLIPEA